MSTKLCNRIRNFKNERFWWVRTKVLQCTIFLYIFVAKSHHLRHIRTEPTYSIFIVIIDQLITLASIIMMIRTWRILAAKMLLYLPTYISFLSQIVQRSVHSVVERLTMIMSIFISKYRPSSLLYDSYY